MELSAEQKRKIEENRQRALAVRANKLQSGCSNVQPPPSSTKNLTLNVNMPTKSSTNSFENTSNSKANFYTKPNTNSSHMTATTSDSYFKSKFSTQPSASGSKPSGGKSNFSKPSGASTQFFAAKDDSGAPVVAKCVLVTRERFAVDAKYFAPMIELFKTMKTRQYDYQTKCWSFDLSEYAALKKEMKDKMSPAVKLEELPKSVLKIFSAQIQGSAAANKRIPIADLSNVDNKLVGTLLSFQREAVDLAIMRDGRLLIADDMGLGKTLQAMCIAAYYKKEWPLLIVSPSSVRFTWQQQLLEWLPSLNPQQINVVLKGKDDCTSGLVNIISYDLMSKCHQRLVAQNFKDESHFLKNAKSVRTKRAIPILKKATRVILLSGTPAMSRPAELYTQLVAINPQSFPSFHEYGLRYCNGKELPWGWDYTGSSNMAELQILMEEKFMIRRLKKDVLTQLPSKYRTMVVLDPSSIKLDKTMKASHKLVEKTQFSERQALFEYFHQSGEAKIQAVRDYVLDLLEADRKFLLFAHHRVVLDAVEDAVKTKGYRYIRIDGSTNSEQRNFVCDKFQTNDEIKIAILSIAAANSGINLTAASLVVFAELFWNPGILVQAEDRVHRIGQVDSVNIQYLVARNTADDFIWPLIQHKLDTLSKAGLSKDDFSEADTRVLQFLSLEYCEIDIKIESVAFVLDEIRQVTEFVTSQSLASSRDSKQNSILSYFKEEYFTDDLTEEEFSQGSMFPNKSQESQASVKNSLNKLELDNQSDEEIDDDEILALCDDIGGSSFEEDDEDEGPSYPKRTKYT